jgi:hypothetical protein
MPDVQIARLLRMVASLEEAIIRLERQREGDNEDTVHRLRQVQGEMLTAVHLLEGDSSHSG